MDAARRQSDWVTAEELGLYTNCRSLSQTGRIEQARAGYAGALRLAKELGDVSAIRAETHAWRCSTPRRGRLSRRARALRRRCAGQGVGDVSAIGLETHDLAVLDGQTGQIEQARAGYAQALRWPRS